MASPAITAIQRAASKYGVDWRSLAAVASYESGLDPNQIGDGGHAFGLFQLNNAGGVLTGKPNPRAYLDPQRNADWAAQAVSKLGIQHLPVNQQIAQIVQRFERPARPGPEIAGAQAWAAKNLKGLGSTPTGLGTAMAGLASGSHSTIQPGGDPVQARQSGLLGFLLTQNAGIPGVDPAAGLLSFLSSPASSPTMPAALPGTLAKTAGNLKVQVDHNQPVAPAAGSVVAQAIKFKGTPYKWGGADPKTGFDCSGFVQYLYAQKGINLPRTTYQQVKVGTPVTKTQNLQPGDIVFFSQNGDVHHEGLYIGNNQFIHAPHTGDVVKISSLSDPYYRSQFIGGRRVTG